VGGTRAINLRPQSREKPADLALLIARGKAATREGKRAEARYHFQRALQLDPEDTEALLWLAYLAGGGRPSLEYLVRALDADPSNLRARSAIRWARSRAAPAAPSSAPVRAEPRRSRTHYAWVALSAFFVVLIGLSVGMAAAAMALDAPTPLPTKARFIAISVATSAPTAVAASTPTAFVTKRGAEQPQRTAGSTPTVRRPLPGAVTSLRPSVPITATAMPLPVVGSVTPETDREALGPVIPPELTPSLEPERQPTSAQTPEPVPNTSNASSTATPLPTANIGANFRWIDVDLSRQTLVAYEGETPVRSAAVSTGLPRTPTVTGRFKIYVKYRAADMSGPGYYLAKVPYIMYFYRGYGLHGTYWHSNFGQPMSHGCVNLPTPEAQWLFEWASVGTPVNIHY